MNLQYNGLSPEELNKIISDRAIRQALSRESHEWFFSVYLHRYIKYGMAPFHKEMFHITEDPLQLLALIVAFRGSGKSTIMTLSFPLWAILGRLEKKFVVIFSKTQQQARQHFINIKQELENNELLKKDLGPFKEISDEWGGSSLVLTDYGARITFASEGQGVRGMRHGPHRPDLLICDDVEDLQAVATKEGRDKVFAWFTSEVIPLGDENTKTVIVGNLLHEDSLLMRLRSMIVEQKTLEGVYKAFPLCDEYNVCLWPQKYPTKADIERQERKIPSKLAFLREYMLRIVSDTERVVYPEWIHYYDVKNHYAELRDIYVGVDLAISDKASADKTAIVTAYVFGRGKTLKICISPHPVNKQLNFPETVDTLQNYINVLRNEKDPWVYVETNGYQLAFAQQVSLAGYRIIDVPSRTDKRTRIALTSKAIEQGKILFPSEGAEELITQLTGFGVERYDDLADAFSLLILSLLPSFPADEGEEINLI